MKGKNTMRIMLIINQHQLLLMRVVDPYTTELHTSSLMPFAGNSPVISRVVVEQKESV